jgi:hypothetical protein
MAKGTKGKPGDKKPPFGKGKPNPFGKGGK